MKIGMICFTARGAGICRLLCGRSRDMETECQGYVPRRFWKPEWEARGILPQDRSFSEWTGFMSGQKRALVFIGVAGIAARAIVSHVRDKMTDPPVMAADETGHFCISLLSGHVGGANEPAERTTGWLNGILVITTATDASGVFAVDISVVRNGLCIIDRREAKEISAWLLDGGEVGFFCDSECHGAEDVKDICRHNICTNRMYGHNIWIIFRNSKRPSFLHLVLKTVVVGVGCRKGTPPDVLERRVLKALEDSGIDPMAVKALSIVDIKTGGVAVSQLVSRYGWELRTFTAGELLAVRGEFKEFGFVGTAVGVGNICKRSCTAGGGILLIYKRIGGGVTVAVAIELVARAGHSQ